MTKYGDIKWGRKEHKGWWLQASFRVLSVSIADTTVIVPVGRCHPPQLTLFRTLTSHPSDARFCSHKLTKLLLSVWRHSEQRVIPNYRIYFSESCHNGTIHFIDTYPLCQHPWYTHLGTSRCAFQFSWPKSGTIFLRADEVHLIVPWNLVPYPCHLISFRPLDQSKSVTLHIPKIITNETHKMWQLLSDNDCAQSIWNLNIDHLYWVHIESIP